MTKDRLKDLLVYFEYTMGAGWLESISTGASIDKAAILTWKSGEKLPSGDELRRLDNFFSKRDQDKRGNDPTEWVRKAEELLAASNVLKVKVAEYWEATDQLRAGNRVQCPFHFMPQFLMLRCFAVECLLKALILKNGGRLHKDGKYIGAVGHQLIKYANEAGLALSKKEKELLDRLEKQNMLGRYPTSSNHDHELFRSRLNKQPKCPWREPQDEHTFKGFLKKIEAQWSSKALDDHASAI